MILKALVCRRFFNQGLTFAFLFPFVFCFAVFLENMYSISNKLNTKLFFEFILLTIVCQGFFFTYLHEFLEIKINVMKYALNCVSWNSLKELFHSVSMPIVNVWAASKKHKLNFFKADTIYQLFLRKKISKFSSQKQLFTGALSQKLNWKVLQNLQENTSLFLKFQLLAVG